MCGAHHWGESNGWEVVDWNAAVSCHHLEEAPRLEGVTIVGEHVCGGKEQGDCRHLHVARGERHRGALQEQLHHTTGEARAGASDEHA